MAASNRRRGQVARRIRAALQRASCCRLPSCIIFVAEMFWVWHSAVRVHPRRRALRFHALLAWPTAATSAPTCRRHVPGNIDLDQFQTGAAPRSTCCTSHATPLPASCCPSRATARLQRRPASPTQSASASPTTNSAASSASCGYRPSSCRRSPPSMPMESAGCDPNRKRVSHEHYPGDCCVYVHLSF